MLHSHRKEKLNLAKDRLERVEDPVLKEQLKTIVNGMDIVVGSMEVKEFLVCVRQCEEEGNYYPLKEKIREIIFCNHFSEERERDDDDECFLY